MATTEEKEYIALISYDGEFGKAFWFNTEDEKKGYISGSRLCLRTRARSTQNT